MRDDYVQTKVDTRSKYLLFRSKDDCIQRKSRSPCLSISAQLLMTEYVQGKSRQVLLANINSGYFVTTATKRQVAQRFPQAVVDWVAVDRSMAKGPPQSPPLTQQEWDFAAVEHALRQWAISPRAMQKEVRLLLQAAEVLTRWRTIPLSTRTE